MVACAKCGAENDTDAKFCKSCGTPILPVGSSTGPGIPPPQPDLGRDMSELGKKMGEDLRKAGERFGHEMEKGGSEFGKWWDQSLGWFSPIIASLLGIIGFFIVLLVVGGIASVSDHPAFWDDLSAFLEQYWWLFFGLAFLSGFQNYFRRRYYWRFLWINPLFNGIGTVAWFWIFAHVLQFASTDWNHPRLGSLADFIDDVLVVLFLLAVILSYLFAFWRHASPGNPDHYSKP